MKVLIFFVTLTAHIWLWGNWNFGKSTQLTLLLVFDSVLALYILGYPLYFLTKNNRIREVFRKKVYFLSVYLYVLLTAMLGMSSFYGLMLYILPIIVVLIVLWTYFNLRSYQLSETKIKSNNKITGTQKDNE